MKQKERHRYVGTLFAGAVFLALVACLCWPDREFSPQENRSLEQRPSLSIQGLLSGVYMKDFEKYVSDQFPLRDFFVHTQATAQRWVGKQENNGVYFGRDGLLFQQIERVQEQQIRAKSKAIAALAKHGSGATVYLMLVPSAGAVLLEDLPPFVSFKEQQQALCDLADQTKEAAIFVDPYRILRDHHRERIYYKTDHHWTTLGAYYGWQELAAAMKLHPQPLDFYNRKTVSTNFRGSLYSQSGYPFAAPDEIQLFEDAEGGSISMEFPDSKKKMSTLYQLENLEKKDQYTVFLGGNESLIHIKTQSCVPRKLLILKDSFANCLIPFLTKDFETIDLVDLRYYNRNISDRIQEEEYTDILILYSAKTFLEEKTSEKMAW